MKAIHYVGILLGLVLLAACTPPTPVSPISPLSPLSVPSNPEGGNYAIRYSREGGIAGTHETWVIAADGRIEVTSGNQVSHFQASSEEVQAVLKEVQDLGFFKLEDSYMPEDTCCDRFTYRLAILNAAEKQQKLVVTMDGAPQPPALSRALELVSTLVQQAKPLP